MTYAVHPIGTFSHGPEGATIVLEPQYAAALTGLAGYSHINIIWWFSEAQPLQQGPFLEKQPYSKGPDQLGTFATRSPARPNSLALSCAQITHIDLERAEIGLAYVDAEPGTPVLDIKPYVPSLDRVEAPRVPDWCAHWPGSIEESGFFDWGKEFSF